jgi:hypothetical protein
MIYSFDKRPIGTQDSFQELLKDLDESIRQVRKNISYLDFYNITESVTNKESLASKVNNLLTNSSLVINTDPFYSNGVYYNTGDLILKDAKGDTQHIKAQTGGIYFPSQLVATDSGYEVEYKFSPSSPTDVSISLSAKQPGDSDQEQINKTSKPYRTITFTNLKESDGGATENCVYGL